MIAHISLIAFFEVFLSSGIYSNFPHKRQYDDYLEESIAERREREEKWNAERMMENQQRCIAGNMTAIYYSSARPCIEASVQHQRDAIKILKTEGPNAVNKFLAYFPRTTYAMYTCQKLPNYLGCCRILPDCELVQNDLHFWISKAREILDDLEEVEATDAAAWFSTDSVF